MSAAPSTLPAPDLAGVGRAFAGAGDFISAEPHGGGHINDTFLATYVGAAGPIRRVLQRINETVFRHVPALMENVARVTAHATDRLSGSAGQRSLRLIPAQAGGFSHRDATGGWWRCYEFVAGAHTEDHIQRPDQARAAARAFGEFQRVLSDLPGARLHETIPDFHHTRRRFEALQRAVTADPLRRVAAAREDIAQAFGREPLVDTMLALHRRGVIPERVTHNDAKLGNVLLDDVTGAAVCVIDLGTVMPGFAPFDFGELVRSGTSTAPEDERDLSRIGARRDIFEALVEGYLSAAGAFLTAAEIANLAFAGRVMTYENGIRFLADHLKGDVYYKITRPGQNLDRARSQFALLRSLEAQQTDFEDIVRKYAGSLADRGAMA